MMLCFNFYTKLWGLFPEMGVLTENYWQFVNKTVICRYFFQSIITQYFSQLPLIKLISGSNNTFSFRKSLYYLIFFLLYFALVDEVKVLSCPDNYWHCGLVHSLPHPESTYRDSGPRKPVTRLRLRYQSQETELRPRADILWTININKHRHQTHHSQTLQMLHLWVWSFLSAWTLKT